MCISIVTYPSSSSTTAGTSCTLSWQKPAKPCNNLQHPVQEESLCLAMTQQRSAKRPPLGGTAAPVPLQVCTLSLLLQYAAAPCCIQHTPRLCCMQYAVGRVQQTYVVCYTSLQHAAVLCSMQLYRAHSDAMQPLSRLCIQDRTRVSDNACRSPHSIQDLNLAFGV